MAKKWAEVIASPGYQGLSAPDKAAAQAQYFDQVVKPQLSPDDVDTAHNQFYSQYPLGSTPADNAPQSAQEAPQKEDKESMSYALNHPVEAFGAFGNALVTGGAKWLLTDSDTGKTATPTGAARNWYAEQMANPETAHNAAVVAKEVPRAIAYGGAAALTEGAAVPLMEAAGFSSPLLATVASNAVGSMAGQGAAGEDLSLSQTAQDALTGVAFHALGGVAKKTATVASDYLPSWLGGKTMATKAAETVNPEHVERVLQGGDSEAQQIYKTATSNPDKTSMLNPSQVFNPTSPLGRSFIGQEQRDLATGTGSQYAQQLEGQRTGSAIEQAISDADTSADLQQAATNITDAFKARSNDLYETSKNSAQDILSGAGVSQLKLPETKSLAAQHLAKHAETGVGLTPEARKTLSNFKKAKIPDISTLDNWKTTLSEKAQKAYRNGDYTSYKALNDVKNNLRNEADQTISGFNPEAGSLYRDADSYFSQMAGDFGKGSPLNKLANTENSVTAENVLLGGDSLAGRFQGIDNTIRTIGAVEKSLDNGNLDNTVLLDELKAGLGGAIRDRAYATATTGEHFSPTKFANKLNQYGIQSNLSGESNINHALSDAIETMRTKEIVGSSLADKLGNVTARGVGAGIGLVKAGPLGAATGQYLAGKAANAVPLLVDKVANTHLRSRAMIDFVSVPENAKRVADIIEARGSSIADTTPEAIKSIIRSIKKYGTQYAVSGNQPDQIASPTETQTQNPVVSSVPEQQAQEAPTNEAKTQFSPGVTNLYHAISDVETGGESDPYVRTKAAEGGKASSAFGPAQITRDLMKDFYSNHADELTDSEKDYAKRFIEQGNKMLKAKPNDPVYGYGKSGELNTPEDRQLYDVVAQKILKSIVENNGGSFNKTVKSWRGKNDSAYRSRVRKAFVKNQSWSNPATA